MNRALMAAIIGLHLALPAQADELRGAEAVLHQAGAGGLAAAEPEKPLTPADRFRQKVQAFPQQASLMPLGDAVTAWMALLEEAGQVPGPARGPYDYEYRQGRAEPSGMALVVTAIPGPEHWELLSDSLRSVPPGEGRAATRGLCLRMLAGLLSSDEQEQWLTLDDLETELGKVLKDESGSRRQALDQLMDQLAAASGDPDRRLALFERKLADAERSPAPSKRYDGSGGMLQVPDLVSMVGPDRAEAYLRRALVLQRTLHLTGRATNQLAQTLALQMPERLQQAQWSLCGGDQLIPLFEVMEARFIKKADGERKEGEDDAMERAGREWMAGGPRQDMYGYAEARGRYLLALLVQGRLDDARRVVNETSDSEEEHFPHWIGMHYDNSDRVLQRLATSPHAAAAMEFFGEQLSEHPEHQYWTTYLALAERLDRADQAIDLMRQMVARPELNRQVRDQVRYHLRTVLLRTDRLDEVAAMLREDFDAAPPEWGYSPAGQSALTLAQIGQLVGRPEWVDEGVTRVQRYVDSQDQAGRSLIVPLAKLLTDLNRIAEAEALLADQLARSLNAKPEMRHDDESLGPQALLASLALVYHRAGRPQDALILLDRAPWWGIRDVQEGAFQHDWMDEHDLVRQEDPPLPLIAATALARTGKADDARAIAKAMIERWPGLDSGYELLADIDGAEAIAYFEQCTALNQFEERPVIWMAEALRRDGRLDEAAATIARAIKIDPSDGEQGPGRRMRAYAVLADIRAAQGRKDDESFLRGVMKAIRTSEQADSLYAAGLRNRALELYRKSLTSFADAYCIQSRLALRLAEAGRYDEAAEHYRRAFQLMPDSFGRVESHCFGCEGVFNGESAQDVADLVFAALVIERADDPRVHYLMGYLRQQQGRHEEALKALQTAVTLDPDYLNAWRKITEIAGTNCVPAELRDQAAVNIYRLQPRSMTRDHPLGGMRDLRLMWMTVHDNPPTPETPAKSMYPLAASKAQLEKLEAVQREAGRAPVEDQWRFMREHVAGEQWHFKSPGEALAAHRSISALSGVFSQAIEPP